MQVFLIGLGALVFAVSLGVIDWLVKKAEGRRTARQWKEREVLLDRRRPVPTTRDILQRRSRSR